MKLAWARPGPLRGTSGWLAVELLTDNSLGGKEQRLVVSAITKDGHVLPEDDPEKLLRLPAQEQIRLDTTPNDQAVLHADLTQRKNRLTEHINRRNLKYFEQEVQKLDAWADDLKVGLENEIFGLVQQINAQRLFVVTWELARVPYLTRL
jgi:hypothetical protein